MRTGQEIELMRETKRCEENLKDSEDEEKTKKDVKILYTIFP